MGQTRNHWNHAQKRLRSRAVGAALAGGLLLSPALTQRAEACGGFWCSLQAPVEQSAEQIIFIDNPDETVTAIIQIQYQGPSEKFAWVIPIPGKPEIAVSSNTAFQRLRSATEPQYQLEVEVEGMCNQQFFRGGPGDLSNPVGSAAPMAGAAEDGGAITVVSMGSVGPYDYTTIAVDPQLADPADAAIKWFRDNGYDLADATSEVLGPYLEDGLNLLAFKLTKSAAEMTGSIRPVVLTYESEYPMVPIRPTAVAAQQDMGIRVWVAAESHAIPQNYKSLVINEALINWFNFRSNYEDVVTAAADEAGGQGFVTELAGKSAQYEQLIWSPADQSNWDMLRNKSYPDPIDAIWQANGYYRGWEGWRDAIEASVTLPQGVSFDDFGRNPNAYRGMAQVDTQEFFEELRVRVVEPVIKTQEMLVSRPYLTRMFSTMSAEEMTVDPSFAYNSDLADVSNIHKAKQYIECTPDKSPYEAPWRIELPQGGVIRGEGGVGFQWPLELDGALPANLKVVQLSTRGSGEVVEDNSTIIGEALFDVSKTVGSGEMKPAKPMSGVTIGGDQAVRVPSQEGPGSSGNTGSGSPSGALDDGGSDEGGCAVASPGAAPGGRASIALGLIAALVLVRRRRANS